MGWIGGLLLPGLVGLGWAGWTGLDGRTDRTDRIMAHHGWIEERGERGKRRILDGGTGHTLVLPACLSLFIVSMSVMTREYRLDGTDVLVLSFEVLT
ncbi:hypothetical protein VTJ04DRAFT_4439 [Mycothermus thermophilus]|uniref:uncharacterized protein n=1 Tax=Humicola insolens TaxID=85995 RepID=UPI0037429074